MKTLISAITDKSIYRSGFIWKLIAVFTFIFFGFFSYINYDSIEKQWQYNYQINADKLADNWTVLLEYEKDILISTASLYIASKSIDDNEFYDFLEFYEYGLSQSRTIQVAEISVSNQDYSTEIVKSSIIDSKFQAGNKLPQIDAVLETLKTAIREERTILSPPFRNSEDKLVSLLAIKVNHDETNSTIIISLLELEQLVNNLIEINRELNLRPLISVQLNYDTEFFMQAARPEASRKHIKVREIALGHEWTFWWYLDNEQLKPDYYSSQLLFIGGCLIALIIIMFGGKLTKELHQLEQEVKRRTDAEKQLKESEYHLKQSQEFANVGSWEWKIDTGSLYWSNSVAEIVRGPGGKSEDNYQNFLEIIHPDDKDDINSATQKCLDGDNYFVEFRVVWPDGSIHWLEESGNALRDETGKAIKLMGVIRDITQRKQLQLQLKNQIKVNEDILNNMIDCVLTTDYKGVITSFNQSAEQNFGYSAKEIIGNNIRTLVAGSDIPFIESILTEKSESDPVSLNSRNKEINGLKKNNTIFPIWVSISEISNTNDKTKNYVWTFHDLTSQKEQEFKIRRSEKMEAMGKLTGGIAHDYNNMLGIILGYAELLVLKYPEDDYVGEKASQIVIAAERSRDLTKRLLAFSRFTVAKTEIVEINELVKNSKSFFEKSLTPNYNLAIDYYEEDVKIKVNKGELEDALLNLIINAKAAMSQGGTISIAISKSDVGKIKSKFLGTHQGKFLQLSIEDTGIGMDDETLAKIFDPFFTTKGGEGTGLGLSQVYGFVQRNKGAIDVYSEVDHGSRFNIFLPLCNSEDETHTKSKIEPTENIKPSSADKTILVVDDEEGLRTLAADILMENNYKVLTAENGEAALKILEQSNVDMVLSDILMPVMDGHTLLKHIKVLYPELPVQLTSGYAESKSVHNNESTLLKPYDMKLLLSMVHELLNPED